MRFNVKIIESQWTPESSPPQNDTSKEADFCFLTPSSTQKSIGECNPIVVKRLEQWTSDLKTFSKSVLPYARVTVPSNAYALGNIVNQDGFLDSGLNAKAGDISQKSVPNPAHTFRLQWHRAILHEKHEDLKVAGADVDRMTILQSLQTLYDIVKITQNDPNFSKQRDRYPNIVNISKLVQKA